MCFQASSMVDKVTNTPVPTHMDRGEGMNLFPLAFEFLSFPHPLSDLIDAPEGWRHVRDTHSGRPNIPYPVNTREVGEKRHSLILTIASLLSLPFTSL